MECLSIDLEVNIGFDWFDLKGEVVVGKYCFLFLVLVKYICNNECFYFLFDGSYFLILEEWMVCYK